MGDPSAAFPLPLCHYGALLRSLGRPDSGGNDIISDPSPSGPSISQSIAAFRQIGLEARHFCPKLSVSICSVGNHTGPFCHGGTARRLIGSEALSLAMFPR